MARPHPQKFDIGYEIITWDLAGEPLGPVLDFVAAQGFASYEALLGDTLGGDFSRRVMTLGDVSVPRVNSDIEMFDRLAFFARGSADHGLPLASLFVDGEWTNQNTWPHERAKAEVVTRFLQSCGASVIVLGGGPPERGTPRSSEDYRLFATRLAEVGQYANSLGLRAAYHPHIDTFVETRAQLDQLMSCLDTELVSLCLDPAHFQVMHDDPVDVFRTYADVTAYVHLKDATGDVGPNDGFARYRAFCELGKGVIDLRAICDILVEREFDGPMIVELDYSPTPNESCKTNADYIRDTLGLELAV